MIESDMERPSKRLKTGLPASSTARTSIRNHQHLVPITDLPTERLPQISRYVPVGCIRIHKSDCAVSSILWQSCIFWCKFMHSRDLNDLHPPYLEKTLQETLLASTAIKQYRPLFDHGWIRMEFKAANEHSGQIRIYILPDDTSRNLIKRHQKALRLALQHLLAQIDVSRDTWQGTWSDDAPIAHVDSSLDGEDQDNASLFHIFNTLPSPKPKPAIINDETAREAMHKILDSQVEGLKTQMHQYQRRSAALMLQREVQPSQILDPRLRRLVDQNGNAWYCDIDSSICLREPRTYETARGGICAETMGLGKTLICLALILASKDMSSQIPVEYSVGMIPRRRQTGTLKEMAAANIGRNGTPWKKRLAEIEAWEGLEYEQCREVIQNNPGYYYLPSPPPRRESRKPIENPPRKIYLTTATLVVVPPNLVKQWEQEIQKHTIGLKVLVVSKDRKKYPLPAAESLAKFDIILFSKLRFTQESADGSDSVGRRMATSSSICQCPYIGGTRERDCSCFNAEEVYRSPLKELHFKRLITDEGHAFGNASKASKTEAITVVEFLQLTARWIISGTPTQGLYGAEVSLSNSMDTSGSSSPSLDSSPIGLTDSLVPSLKNAEEMGLAIDNAKDRFFRGERKDLEKLGNIASVYLKARPWANTLTEGDTASWMQYVLQPRHGSKGRGNMGCLRATLEGMIIRHRPEDVEQDVVLPHLQQDVVYLEGSIQDKLSLNMFSMMIVSNAVTSERKDADYLFHPRQRKPLDQLVSNLRQASFHWSGFTMDDVRATIEVARKFLEKAEIPCSADDVDLLREAIRVGELVLNNSTKGAISQYHEMPMYVQNDFPEESRAAWALDGKSSNPTLMGATMVHAAQKHVGARLSNPLEGFVEAGQRSLESAEWIPEPPRALESKSRDSHSKKSTQVITNLAGGVTVVSEGSSKKRMFRSTASVEPRHLFDSDTSNQSGSEVPTGHSTTSSEKFSFSSAAKSPHNSDMPELDALDPSSPLASASIISTASTKLSYLMRRISEHQKNEKILVFYEADNVAYYIAQALECLHIKHLIYAKTLPTSRKAQYVVTFNQTETFRVLLMDISQAAFGLDMSSASRVFFVNPVFSPQIEAQAVKRAHRIGQTKPVFVETLVLKDSIEEVILDRRKHMTNEEHNNCKSILDDGQMYDWIRNVRFIPVETNGVSSPDQMAKLDLPRSMFGTAYSGTSDPDADLLSFDSSPKGKSKARRKRMEKGSSTTDDRDTSEILYTVQHNRRRE